MKTAIEKALRTLQRAAAKHFGKTKSETGENCVFIGPDKIDLTNFDGSIVARGPAQVARVLRRKRRVK